MFINLFRINQIGQARVQAQGCSPEPAQGPLQVSRWIMGPFMTVQNQYFALKVFFLVFIVKLQGQSPYLQKPELYNLPEHRAVIYWVGRDPQARPHSGATSVI